MTLTLEPRIEGKLDGPTLLFVQGWPDDASIWDAPVAALADRYRCVRVTLPNYGGDRSVRWGFTTDEILAALVTLVEDLAAGGRIGLVLHDWGCYWGHAVHHRIPQRIERVAGLDISPHLTPSPAAAAGLVAYQGWLFGAFVLGGSVGDWMTRAFAKLAGAPRATETDATMNYPYRNIWGDIASGRAKRMTAGYWPRCPLFFAYGTQKPFPFHSERWLAHVRSVRGGEVVAIDAGHWLPGNPQTVEALSTWLDASARYLSGDTTETAEAP